MSGYDDDLAYIHDVGFADFATGAAPGLLRIFHQRGIRDGLVVDLGCGSGRWAERLAAAGFGVWGIDLSPAMVEMARTRVPHGDFHAASFLDVELPPCDVVTSLGEVFSYAFDGRNGHEALRRLFRRVYTALKPHGLFVFDIAAPGRGAGPAMKHFQGPDWAVLVDVHEDAGANRLTRRITTFRKVGESFRRRHESHDLRLYQRSVVATDLRHVGFRVRTVRRYGKQELPTGQVGFLANKP